MEERRSKQRLKQDERINQILLVAEKAIQESGFEGVNINRIIDDCTMSRGTFFSIIPSKETLIAYLAIKGCNRLIEMLEVVKLMKGTSREKILTIYLCNLIFLKKSPILNECILDAYNSTGRSSLTVSLKTLLDRKMNDIIGFVQWAIEQGVLHKELRMPERLSTFDFAFYIWAGQFGVSSLSRNTQNNVIDASKKYKHYLREMLDSLPWHPTSKEFDYTDITIRILTQELKVTPEEIVLYGIADS